ncbi:MAG: 6,7-dimethyl-8-ribityllumazine synthase [bacterium]
MARIYKGEQDGTQLSIAIIQTQWNEDIVEEMATSALSRLKELGTDENKIDRVTVPGAYEIPLAAKYLAESLKYDAIIALGCVIRGETAHFDYVAGEASRGISDVALSTGTPVIFGILTTETKGQAVRRAAITEDNKGREYAEVAIEMANLRNDIRKDDTSWRRVQ